MNSRNKLMGEIDLDSMKLNGVYQDDADDNPEPEEMNINEQSLDFNGCLDETALVSEKKKFESFQFRRQESTGIVKSIWQPATKNELAAKGMQMSLISSDPSQQTQQPDDDDIQFIDHNNVEAKKQRQDKFEELKREKQIKQPKVNFGQALRNPKRTGMLNQLKMQSKSTNLTLNDLATLTVATDLTTTKKKATVEEPDSDSDFDPDEKQNKLELEEEKEEQALMMELAEDESSIDPGVVQEENEEPGLTMNDLDLNMDQIRALDGDEEEDDQDEFGEQVEVDDEPESEEEQKDEIALLDQQVKENISEQKAALEEKVEEEPDEPEEIDEEAEKRERLKKQLLRIQQKRIS